jgi:hypothetical protein
MLLQRSTVRVIAIEENRALNRAKRDDPEPDNDRAPPRDAECLSDTRVSRQNGNDAETEKECSSPKLIDEREPLKNFRLAGSRITNLEMGNDLSQELRHNIVSAASCRDTIKGCRIKTP